MLKVCTVFTFKNTSKYKNNYILIKDLNIYNAVKYAQEKYGDDIDSSYPLTKKDFNLVCFWKDGLYEECINNIKLGEKIIRKRRLQCIEVVIL